MNVLDLILIIPIAYDAYKGFSKGFVYEIFSLLALGLGIYGCLEFSEFASDYLAKYVDKDKDWFPIATYTLTFIAIVVGVTMLGKLLDKMISLIQLGLVNKLFGVLFGVLKAAFFLSGILMVCNAINTSFNFIDPELADSSLLYQPLSEFLIVILPGNSENSLLQQFKEGFNDLFL